MPLADSRETGDENLTQHRAQAAADPLVPRSNKRTSPGSQIVSRGRRLDVDAVLERSVRRVETEQSNSQS